MVPPHLLPNIWVGKLGDFPKKIHGNLPRFHYFAAAIMAHKVINGNTEEFGDSAQNLGVTHPFRRVFSRFFNDFLGNILGDLYLLLILEENELFKHSLKLPDVLSKPAGKQIYYLFTKRSVCLGKFTGNDGDPHLVFRITDVGYKSSLKTRTEAFLERSNGLWRPGR